MTITEAIAAIDRLRPNQYTQEEKILWLSQLDGQIYAELLQRRQRKEPPAPGWPNPLGTGEDPVLIPPEPPAADEETWSGEDLTEEFAGYDSETAGSTELLAPWPYDRELYTAYLMMKVDESNAEFEKYNQSVVLFNTALEGYRNWLNRQRKAAGPRRFWW